jgi:hypothetical protein
MQEEHTPYGLLRLLQAETDEVHMTEECKLL